MGFAKIFIILIIHKIILGQMSYNVPVVYDVFAARMSETAGFAGLQKCGGTKHHKRRSSA
jgi:hypothetical protein